MKPIILLALIVQVATCLNILALLPYEGKSHYYVFRVLTRELAQRGHTVTVLSPFQEDNVPSNYKQIRLTPKVSVESSMTMKSTSMNVFKIASYLAQTSIDNCESILQNTNLKILIKEKAKFDVVLVEQFQNDCGFAIAHKLGAPAVGLTSHILMPWHYLRAGISFNAAYVPFHFTGFGTTPNYFERLYVYFLDIYFNLMYNWYVQPTNQRTVDMFLGTMPPLNELAGNVKFMLTYTHFSLTGKRIWPSNFIEVGGYHVKETGKIPVDLKKFMDEATNGVIYISFGSVADPSTMSPRLMESLLYVIEAFPYRFVWKYHNDTFSTDNEKLYLSSWLPQVDILAHPKTVAFISHCGMLSTSEAITFGVPMIAMPLFGDQPANSASIVESGLGVRVDLDSVTPRILNDALANILMPRFTKKVKALSKIWKDRPMSPIDAAIYWIDYTARHQNHTFVTPTAYKSSFVLMNFDIMMTIAIVIIGFLGICFKVCCSFQKRPPVKPTKSKSKHKRH